MVTGEQCRPKSDTEEQTWFGLDSFQDFDKMFFNPQKMIFFHKYKCCG